MAIPSTGDEVVFGMGTLPHKSDTGCINDLLVCCYDEAHVVAGGRYHAHIAACRKRHQRRILQRPWENLVEVDICPYNISHHVDVTAMRKHIIICDDFFNYCSERQVEPVSMQVIYQRYKNMEIKMWKTPAENEDDIYGELQAGWDSDDEDVPIKNVNIQDVNGSTQRPATRGEFRTVKYLSVLKAVRERMRRFPRPPRICNVSHSMSLEGMEKRRGEDGINDVIEELVLDDLLYTTDEDKKRAVEMYVEQSVGDGDGGGRCWIAPRA